MRNFSQIKKRRKGAREEKKTQQGESPLIVGSGLAILLRRSPLLWFVLCACCSCSKQHNVFLRSGGGEHRLTEWQMGPAKLHMMGSDCLSLYVKEFLKEIITRRSAFCAPWIHRAIAWGDRIIGWSFLLCAMLWCSHILLATFDARYERSCCSSFGCGKLSVCNSCTKPSSFTMSKIQNCLCKLIVKIQKLSLIFCAASYICLCASCGHNKKFKAKQMQTDEYKI